MPATITETSFNTGANSAQGRTDFANALSTAFQNAGMTLFDSFGDGTSETRVMRMALNPSGFQFARFVITTPSSYSIAWSMLETWDEPSNTGTFPSQVQSATLGAVNANYTFQAINHAELKGVNIFIGTFLRRLFIGSPLHLPSDWVVASYPNALIFDFDEVATGPVCFYSPNNPANANIATGQLLPDALNRTVVNARTGRPNLRMASFYDNTNGQQSGFFSNEIVFTNGSTQVALNQLSDTNYRNIVACTNLGLAIKV